MDSLIFCSWTIVQPDDDLIEGRNSKRIYLGGLVMDMCDALSMWNRMGNETNSYNDVNGNYTIDFIKNGAVVGWIKVYSGQGIRWNYPEELMQVA